MKFKINYVGEYLRILDLDSNLVLHELSDVFMGKSDNLEKELLEKIGSIEREEINEYIYESNDYKVYITKEQASVVNSNFNTDIAHTDILKLKDFNSLLKEIIRVKNSLGSILLNK
jgi:hypothetical protein